MTSAWPALCRFDAMFPKLSSVQPANPVTELHVTTGFKTLQHSRKLSELEK